MKMQIKYLYWIPGILEHITYYSVSKKYRNS